MNNKGTWIQLHNYSQILSFVQQVASNFQEIQFPSAVSAPMTAKWFLWPGWWIEKLQGPPLKKHSAAVQSVGDLFANMFCEKGYFSIVFICIFLLVSLKIFSYGYWPFEFVLLRLVHLTNPLPIFIVVCLYAIKCKSWLYTVNFNSLCFMYTEVFF